MPNDELTATNPVLARHEGVWKGMYRRYDAEGRMQEEFPSTVVARFFPPAEDGATFHQTNVYDHASREQEVLETRGTVQDGRLSFSSGRVDGWTADDPADIHGRSCLLYMEYGFLPNSYVYETVQISADNRYRCRATQFIRDGKTFQRTLIDEEKVSDDWAAWDREQGR
jgi:hypothetical protein